MARSALIALLCCAGLPCAAEEDRSYVAPALEAELAHFSFLAFSNLVTGQTFARVTPDTIASHFDGRSPWQFDEDYFYTNGLGHPYQGALTFTAARSAGLSFWVSALYATFASVTWELFFEVDPPSINDVITTSIGGVLLGEVLHRSALAVLRDEGTPRWVRYAAAFVLEPLGAFNRWLFAYEVNESDTVTPQTFGLVGAGVSVRNGHTDFGIQAQLTYGVFDPRAPPGRAPLSHFDLELSVTVRELPVGTLFVRGLLYGNAFGTGPRLRGVWGVFGTYDYAQSKAMRVSAMGVGPGSALQWRFSRAGFLQASAALGLSPYGQIGALGLDEETERDYHIGPGFSALAEVRLVHSEVAMARAVVRQWVLAGVYAPPYTWQAMTHLTLGAVLRLGGPVGVVVESVSEWNGRMRDALVTVSLCWLSNEHFGVLAPTVLQ